jgi:cytochrome c-type biogenesis protein CcmH
MAVMTAVAVAALVWPLARRRAPEPTRAEHDLVVYRDQLKELERDTERGLLNAEQASAAKIEIQRRMLAAADANKKTAAVDGLDGAWAVAVVAALVPAGAFALYLHLGQPGQPDQPLAERLAEAPAAEDGPPDVAKMVDRLARRLAENPDDLQGWLMLGRSYMVQERFADAAQALANANRLGDNSPDIAANYGEALAAAAEGIVTPAARAQFQSSLEADPQHPKARYYLGLALAQEGRLDEALQTWVDLAADSSPDASWQDAVFQQIERVAAELGVDPAAIKPTPEAGGGKSAAPGDAPLGREPRQTPRP